MYIYVKGTKYDKEAFLSFELVLVSSEAPVDIEACCCDVFGPKRQDLVTDPVFRSSLQGGKVKSFGNLEDAKKAATSAMSTGRPNSPRGICETNASFTFTHSDTHSFSFSRCICGQ